MLGRFQRGLHRGVLAGLQQQHQQQCQQLEVLGLQAARTFFNDYKPSQMQPKRVKKMIRRNEALQKVTSKKQQVGSTPAAAADSSSSTSLDAGSAAASSTAADGAASSTAADATAAAAPAAPSSGPVSSPLSQVPRAPGSSSSAPAAVPAAAAAAAPSKQESKSSWVPAWLDNIMDFPRRRRAPRPAPGTTSPLQSNAPDAAAAAPDPKSSSKEDDGWAQLEQWRGMTLEVYQGIIATDPGADGGGEKAPRPNKPADRGPGSALRARMDTRRVMYARYEQQSSLISMMDEDDKLRVKLDPLAFLRDHDAIARVARSTQNTVSAVRDMVFSYQKRRDFAELMLQHRDSGGQMPLMGDQQSIHDLHYKLQQQRARREHLEVLKELMDPQNCQLRAWGGVINKNRKCPHTDLAYGDCCGSKQGAKLARKVLRQ